LHGNFGDAISTGRMLRTGHLHGYLGTRASSLYPHIICGHQHFCSAALSGPLAHMQDQRLTAQIRQWFARQTLRAIPRRDHYPEAHSEFLAGFQLPRFFLQHNWDAIADGVCEAVSLTY
jgi:hypothetical protein